MDDLVQAAQIQDHMRQAGGIKVRRWSLLIGEKRKFSIRATYAALAAGEV